MKRYIDGHVNKTVERKNFCKHTQKVGKSFDDFLVSLQELVKTCNFCSDACTNKNIRDQIIDTTKDLLQETNLILDKAISKRQAQEAAKKQQAHLHNHGTEFVATLHKPQGQAHQNTTTIPTCQGCGAPIHPSWPKLMSDLSPDMFQLPESWTFHKSLPKQTTQTARSFCYYSLFQDIKHLPHGIH